MWTRIMLAFVLLTPCISAQAVKPTIEGVTFESVIQRDDAKLHLAGTALLRYRVVFRAYVGALYLEKNVAPSRVLDDVPKRLELEYFWAIKGRDMVDAADPILRDNVSEETLKSLAERLEKINAAYRDVEPGDRYALTYIPGEGTELALNNKPLVVVEGADFAAAYFSIWLGAKPLDEKFKRQLLEGK